MAAQTPRRLNIITKLIRFLGRCAAWFLLACGLFYAAAIIGGLIAANPQWREPDHGVEIFVETNGVHTALILPRVYNGHDWADFLPASDLSDPVLLGNYLSFSWGERNFYLETEHWRDVKAQVLLKAATGSDETLMHIYHYRSVRDGPYARSLTITEAQYHQLIDLIRQQFVTQNGQRAAPLPGYGERDMFYPAKGRYSLWYGCNNWTSSTLAQIGVTVGIWTPMESGVMRWFPQEKR